MLAIVSMCRYVVLTQTPSCSSDSVVCLEETRDVRGDVISTRCRELQLKVRVGRIVCLSVDGDSSLVRPRNIDGNTSPRAERARHACVVEARQEPAYAFR